MLDINLTIACDEREILRFGDVAVALDLESNISLLHSHELPQLIYVGSTLRHAPSDSALAHTALNT